MTNYKMYLCLGDSSGDGHGQSEDILLYSNYPVEKVRQAYKDSCKLTGVSFNHNEDFTGRNRNWETADNYRIATEYEQFSTVYPETREALKEHGIDLPDDEELGDNSDWFQDLLIEFIKLSLPDLNLRPADQEEKIPYINGGDLAVQFGYGLYT